MPAGLVDTRHEYDHVFSIYVPIALGVLALVVAVVVVAVLRYRRRSPEAAARWHEHTRLEGLYGLILVATIAFLLYVTFSAEHQVDTVAARERPQLTINVIGARWEWHFNYPEYGIDRYSGTTGEQSLVVPAGEAVRFRISSQDVIHAFWIPELRYKHDAIPGSTQQATLVFEKAGTFAGACAEFCGLYHARMLFKARVVAPAAFAAWARAGGRTNP